MSEENEMAKTPEEPAPVEPTPDQPAPDQPEGDEPITPADDLERRIKRAEDQASAGPNS